MKYRKSKTKVLGSSSLGAIPYRVVRTGPHKVSIFISRAWKVFFHDMGADLSVLDEIGNHRAREVMTNFVKSVEK